MRARVRVKVGTSVTGKVRVRGGVRVRTTLRVKVRVRVRARDSVCRVRVRVTVPLRVPGRVRMRAWTRVRVIGLPQQHLIPIAGMSRSRTILPGLCHKTLLSATHCLQHESLDHSIIHEEAFRRATAAETFEATKTHAPAGSADRCR